MSPGLFHFSGMKASLQPLEIPMEHILSGIIMLPGTFILGVLCLTQCACVMLVCVCVCGLSALVAR